jgi:hypothetical protein
VRLMTAGLVKNEKGRGDSARRRSKASGPDQSLQWDCLMGSLGDEQVISRWC